MKAYLASCSFLYVIGNICSDILFIMALSVSSTGVVQFTVHVDGVAFRTST